MESAWKVRGNSVERLGHFWVVFGLFLSSFLIIFGSFWGRFSVVLESFWGVLVSFWSRFGVIFGVILGHFGVMFWSIRLLRGKNWLC